MSKLAAVKTENRIGRPLKVLIPLIQQELQEGDRAGLEHYRRAGELLLEARDAVAPFKWGAWLSQNFALSRPTAYRYMKLAEVQESRLGAETTITGAIGESSRDSRRFSGGWQPIKEFTAKIDTDRLAQERQTIETEVRLHRELAMELITAGYRALATRLRAYVGDIDEAVTKMRKAVGVPPEAAPAPVTEAPATESAA